MFSPRFSSAETSSTVRRKRKHKDIVQDANDMVVTAQEIIDFFEGKLKLLEKDKEEKITRLKNYCENQFSVLSDKDKAWINEQIEEEKKKLENELCAPDAIVVGVEKTRAYLLKNWGTVTLAYNSPQAAALEKIGKKIENVYGKGAANIIWDFMKHRFYLMNVLSMDDLTKLSIELDRAFMHGKPDLATINDKVKPYIDVDIDAKIKALERIKDEQIRLRQIAEQRIEENRRLLEEAKQEGERLARLTAEVDQRTQEQRRLKQQTMEEIETLKQKIADFSSAPKRPSK